MKNTIKRMLALVFVFALVMSLCACGGEKTNTPAAQNGTQSGSVNTGTNQSGSELPDAFDTNAFIASMPAELKGTTIKFLNWYDPYKFGQEGQVIDAFKAATGINVELIVVEDGAPYKDKLAGLVATGDAPDLYAMECPNVAYMKSAQPIVNATGYDFAAPEWSPVVKQFYSVNGTLYAANLSYTPFLRLTCMAYNKQIIEEFGFEDPWELYKKGDWTWEKVAEMSAEWIKQGPDYYGVATNAFDICASTRGIDFMSYDGKQWNLNLYDADVLDAWRWTLEKKAERIFVQGTNVSFDAAKPKALFSTMNTAGLEKMSTWNSKIRKYGYFAAVPTPHFDGTDAYSPIGELNAFAVPIGAKNPKAVPYFISYFSNLAMYNIDEYYFDEQSKDVMIEILGNQNKFLSMANDVFSFDANPFAWNLFNNGTSSQITTFIQSMEYQCQDKLNQLNEILATK